MVAGRRYRFQYRDNAAADRRVVFEMEAECIVEADLAMHTATGIGRVKDGAVVGIPANIGCSMTPMAAKK